MLLRTSIDTRTAHRWSDHKCPVPPPLKFVPIHARHVNPSLSAVLLAALQGAFLRLKEKELSMEKVSAVYIKRKLQKHM